MRVWTEGLEAAYTFSSDLLSHLSSCPGVHPPRSVEGGWMCWSEAEVPVKGSSVLFIAALFLRAKRWKQSECPLADRWINKMCDIATQWNIIQP